MPTETARSIVFGLRRCAIQPVSAGAGVTLGVPIVLDTQQELKFAIDVGLEGIMGGAYVLELAADVKEMKATITGKNVDCPPTLWSLMTAGTYVKNSVSGPALDALGVYNVVGTSVASRITVTAASGAVTGDYVIVATAANTYTVYNMVTGAAGASVTTSASMSTMDTTSIANVTITTAMGTFTANDAANFHIVNVGASGFETSASQETISGPATVPVVPPQVRIFGDTTRRGVIYRFMANSVQLEGSALDLGQGKYMVPELKGRVLQPAAGVSPWRLDRVS